MSSTPPKTERKLTTPAQRAKIVDAYVTGKTIREAATAAGVAYSTAHAALVRAEVPRRRRGSGRPNTDG
jgi:hypothetical protein